MPVNPPNAYPNVEAVMNRTRAYINDAFSGGAGRILTDNAPFSVEYFNGALEELQDELRDYDAITLIHDNYLMTIPAILAVNPAVQINISFTGFFDGTVQHATPRLPPDCLIPEVLGERQSGSANDFSNMELKQILPGCMQCEQLQIWEWRTDMIWMVGATTARDLRLRYKAQLAPISPNTPSNPWSNVMIGIQASVESLSHLVAYRYARARGAQAAAIMQADAAKALHSVKNRYIKQQQGIRIERVPYDRDSQGFRIPGII
jgi:hypothetical protein